MNFSLEEIDFLVHFTNRDGGKAGPKNVKSIEEWKTPKDSKDCQRFLGLIGRYRWFIKDFSKLASLLRLFANQPMFNWKQQQQDAFDKLKKRLMKDPILKPFDSMKSLILSTDFSKGANGLPWKCVSIIQIKLSV